MFIEQLLCSSYCAKHFHTSSHFILAADQQVHVVVPILQIGKAKLREVKGFIQGHHGGGRNFGVQPQHVWVQKSREYACKNLVGNNWIETIATWNAAISAWRPLRPLLIRI